MKTLNTILILLVLLSCNNSSKKKIKTTETIPLSESNAIETSNNNAINLKQNGNYTRLYALVNACKITAEEVATLFGITIDAVKETVKGASRDGGYTCNFSITLRDGSESVFGATVFKRPKADVRAEIEKKLSSSYEKKFMSISNSGDQYLWKHPNQGYFILYNPNYNNGIKIQYRAMLVPGLTQAQKEYLEQKGIHTANYLIEKYKD